MRKETQKQKLLYLAKILYEETDEEHILTADKIITRLNEYGISCERKTIYSDMDILSEFGMDIVREHRGAWLASRMFELPELKLLVDAVQSSKFITENKSRELIGKLSRLSGKAYARKLTGQVVVRDRVKSMNESIYYNIDNIQDAIRQDHQITFGYYEWNVKKELVPRKAGERCRISPWFFQWDNDKYYLVGYDDATKQMRHYRVDKMKEIVEEPEMRLGRKMYEQIDLSSYGTQTFGMFAGEKVTVTLIADATLAGAMIDHFGREVWMHPAETWDEEEAEPDENDRRCRKVSVVVDTVVSDRFFGWVFGFGDKLKIAEPAWVQEAYIQMMKKVCEQYERGTL